MVVVFASPALGLVGLHVRTPIAFMWGHTKCAALPCGCSVLKHMLVVCRRARFSFLSSSHLPSYLRSSYAEGSDSEGDGPEDEPDAEEEADAEEEVMEAQWRSYVDKLRQSGELSSCLAVADVSGSMEGQPMNVSSSSFPARLLIAWHLWATSQILSV